MFLLAELRFVVAEVSNVVGVGNLNQRSNYLLSLPGDRD